VALPAEALDRFVAGHQPQEAVSGLVALS